jgi:hypothetical protein
MLGCDDCSRRLAVWFWMLTTGRRRTWKSNDQNLWMALGLVT